MVFSVILNICLLVQHLLAISYYLVSLIFKIMDRKNKSEPSVSSTEAHFCDKTIR